METRYGEASRESTAAIAARGRDTFIQQPMAETEGKGDNERQCESEGFCHGNNTNTNTNTNTNETTVPVSETAPMEAPAEETPTACAVQPVGVHLLHMEGQVEGMSTSAAGRVGRLGGSSIEVDELQRVTMVGGDEGLVLEDTAER